MTLLAPELLPTNSYPFQSLRYLFQQMGIIRSGIVKAGDMAMSPGAGMQVSIAAGGAWIIGTTATRQGAYHQVNDAPITANLAAADGTNPRIDSIYLVINDSSVSGASNNCVPQVQTGTPTSGASLTNPVGRNTTVPANSLFLGNVAVPAAAGSIPGGNIGGPADGKNSNVSSIAAAPPPYAFGRPIGYVPAAHASLATGGQSLTNVTWTAISMANTLFDTDSIHPATSQYLTCKTPGYYMFSAQIQYASGGATNDRSIRVRNTTSTNYMLAQDDRPAAGGSMPTTVRATGPVFMNYGDQIWMEGYQDSGGALTVNGSSFQPGPTFLSMVWVGPS